MTQQITTFQKHCSHLSKSILYYTARVNRVFVLKMNGEDFPQNFYIDSKC